MVSRELERAQRVVAAAYAWKHADGITLELIEALERENVGSRARIYSAGREGHTRTGRYVVGRAASTSIGLIALVLTMGWYRYTAEGAELRKGYDEGHRDASARWAPPSVARVDSRMSGVREADRVHGTNRRGVP